MRYILLLKLLIEKIGPKYISTLLGGDMNTAKEIGKATGYVFINKAIRENKRIKLGGTDGVTGYDPNTINFVNDPTQVPSAEALECAEWCAKYDCSSVTNPEGVPMDSSLIFQAGFEQCPEEKRKSDASCCWWYVDWKTRGTPNQVDDYNKLYNDAINSDMSEYDAVIYATNNCDLFFSKP